MVGFEQMLHEKANLIDSLFAERDPSVNNENISGKIGKFDELNLSLFRGSNSFIIMLYIISRIFMLRNKMIRGLLYRFHRWVVDYANQPDQEAKYTTAGRSIVTASSDVEVEGLRFTVMTAHGGTIVQIRRYDRRKDEQHMKTYVIPESEQDIAHRVGQIVAIELFKI